MPRTCSATAPGCTCGGGWVGEYANVSVFDVEDHDTLHRLLSGLPLFPYLRLKVTPLARHPSAIA